MVEWIVISHFAGVAFKGLLVGFIIRFLISIFFRTDMTFGGLIRTGLVMSAIYVLIEVYMYMSIDVTMG